MTKLVEQGLFVGPESFGRLALLRATRFLKSIGEKRKVVLGGFELVLQDVSFRRHRFGFGIGTRHVSLQ